MGFFSKLFGGDEEHGVTASKTGKATKWSSSVIAYDADLVDNLKGEHQELVRVFTAIKTSATEGDLNQLPELLANFKHLFLSHVGLENVKFYVYMQQHQAIDAESLNFISNVRKEMNNIARAVMKFIDAHITTLPSPDTVAGFNAELDQIGAVLIKRVQMEESRLYPLYQP